MKKHRKWVHVLLACIFVAFVPGCQSDYQICSTLPNESNDSLLQSGRSSTEPSQQQTVGNYQIINQCWKDNSHQDSQVTIYYPMIHSKTGELSKLNQAILDFATTFATNTYGDDYTGLTMDIHYKIARIDEKIVSIIFEGLGSVRAAAHPNNLFVTLNYSLPEANFVKLNDIFDLDETFLNTYIDCFQEQIDPQIVEGLSQLHLDKQSILKDLEISDTPETETCCYFLENKVGIRITVSHALGDHLEIEIPIDRLGHQLKERQTIFLSNKA